MNVLNKSKNFYRAIGTVSENALKRDTVKIDLRNDKGEIIGSEETERIMGTVSINIGSGVMDFNAYQTKLNSFPNKNGEYDNPRWKMAEAMAEWKPEISGNSGNSPTFVEISGTVAVNDYVKDGKVNSPLRWNISKATTHTSAENKGSTLSVTAFIQQIQPEVIQEEETGRLMVKLFGVDGKGECFPIDCYVRAEMADDFVDIFEVGQTIEANIDAVIVSVGGKKKPQQFGGNGTIDTKTSWDKKEYIIVGGSVIEEPEELTTEDENGNEIPVKTDWINPIVMKKAIKVRQQKIEELKNKESNSASETKTSTTTARSEIKKVKGFGNSTNYVDFDDDETDPF